VKRLLVDTQQLKNTVNVLDNLITRRIERISKLGISIHVRHRKKIPVLVDRYNVIRNIVYAAYDVNRNHYL